MIFDDDFIKDLFGRAKESDRQRQNFDLRTSTADQSQRMMNALLPGTQVAYTFVLQRVSLVAKFRKACGIQLK